MYSYALELILRYEGGYVNNPNDPGGATNKGITQATYDNYLRGAGRPWQSVKKITDEEVSVIYERNYWRDGGCELIATVQPCLAAIHFDFCVNAGIRQATKILQRTVGAVDDGILGPKTLDAIRTQQEFDTIENYSIARTRYYRLLARNRAKSVEFLRGWLVRVAQIEGRMYEYRARNSANS